MSYHSTQASTYEELRSELATDWLPDPWAWHDLTNQPTSASSLWPSIEQETVMFLPIPLVGGRSRYIPLLQPSTRLFYHSIASEVAWQSRHLFSDGVFGYRAQAPQQLRPHRPEYQAKLLREKELANAYPWVLETDITNFFPCVSSHHLKAALSQTPLDDVLVKNLLDITRLLESKIGYALPEGYAAARALANFVLRPVDASLSQPFTRWLDDYRIFVSTRSQAEEELEHLTYQLDRLGFKVNQNKTAVLSIDQLEDRAACSLGPHDESEEAQDIKKILDEAGTPLAGRAERLTRHMLKEAALQADGRVPEILMDIPIERLSGSLVPRLAWLLSTTSHNKASQDLMRRLLTYRDNFTNWRLARLSAAAWYYPRPALDDLDDLLEHTTEAGPWLALSAGRFFARHRRQQLDSSHVRAFEPAFQKRIISLTEEEAQEPEVHSKKFGGPPVKSWL